MTYKLPGYHIIAGCFFFVMGELAKHNLPQTVGMAPAIQLPCAFFSAVCMPLGTFLALRALLVQTAYRRKLLIEFLFGILFLLTFLSFYFFVYVTMNRTLDLVKSPPSLLPIMVETARTLPKEAQREKMAALAYQIYGKIIAYPLDNNQVVYYVPSDEDITKWQQMEKSNAQIKKSTALVQKLTLQFPYLFALYACTYFCTFLIGGTWLILKSPPASSSILI
jgi:hypothetical protein